MSAIHASKVIERLKYKLFIVEICRPIRHAFYSCHRIGYICSCAHAHAFSIFRNRLNALHCNLVGWYDVEITWQFGWLRDCTQTALAKWETHAITYGVAQGSFLGPVLFY